MSAKRLAKPLDGPDLKWCDPCNKRDLRTKKAALGEASRVRKFEGEVVTAYKCRHGAHHIGHPMRGQVWVETMERMAHVDGANGVRA